MAYVIKRRQEALEDIFISKTPRDNKEYLIFRGKIIVLDLSSLSSPFVITSKRIYAEIFNRGIKIISDNETLLESLYHTLPSIEWQIKQLEWRNSLPYVERNEIRKYTGNEYRDINKNLRALKPSFPVLNPIIFKSPEIDRDIIVFRVINKDFMLPSNSLFISLGYLSTTLSLTEYGEVPVIGESIIMRIKIPKGKKAIYYPDSEEHELIFPHNVLLHLSEIKMITYFFPSNKKYIKYPTIEAVMI